MLKLPTQYKLIGKNMNLKAKTTFKHRGYQFIKDAVYDVNNKDAEYFISAKWLGKTKEKAEVTVPELGFDPETKWAHSDKKIMGSAIS